MITISHIHVTNYKGLRDVAVPFSSYTCAIGENNAGKSSLLQAVLLFIRGTKLSKAEYYDPTQEILIVATITGITPEVLEGLAEEHRNKLTPFVRNNTIALARRYGLDGASQLRHYVDVPIDRKYRDNVVDEAFKGKKGKDIADVVTAFYPEVADAAAIAGLKTQGAAKDLIAAHVARLPPERLEKSDIPLVTGFDNSVRYLLPEPIYIPAVKDLADELKTKEGASFGKLLNILLDVIEGDLSETAETFENLRRKLNRITAPDGVITDDRMQKVRDIEETIQRNLQETFRNVNIELQIPPPEIKTVLSSATILADDGVKGPVENKGDGFKRAIAFSILRSYVQLSQSADWRAVDQRDKPTKDRFLFLFEEPELYLHPRAQNILFDALALISKRHQVAVTTHSPLFFSASDTTTFIRISKQKEAGLPRPVADCRPIDLTDVAERDKFQIISFETSNIAFFANRIVLVEGDSEAIVFPHLARLLNQAWDFKSSSTNLVRISGKGSFRRYREFFQRFGVHVALIADLDVIVRDFDKLNAGATSDNLRQELLRQVDKIIDDANAVPPVPPRLLREQLQRERTALLVAAIQAARVQGDANALGNAIEQWFAFERTEPRLEVLKDRAQLQLLPAKRALFADLRGQDIYVLERGEIEDYYPLGVIGPDKPSKAQSLCAHVTTVEQARALSDKLPVGTGDLSELEVIFSRIFQ